MEASKTIELIEDWSVEVTATRARLNLEVSGSRLFTGKAALTQAVELRQLCEALRGQGLTDDAISLSSVRVSVSSGLLGRSSSAQYGVRARCDDLSRLPALLDVISAQKSCTLRTIEWDYEGNEGPQADAEKAALLRLRRRAEQLMSATKLKLSSEQLIQELPEHSRFQGVAPTAFYGEGGGYGSIRKRKTTVSEALEGAELTPTTTISGRLRVVFLISPDIHQPQCAP